MPSLEIGIVPPTVSKALQESEDTDGAACPTVGLPVEHDQDIDVGPSLLRIVQTSVPRFVRTVAW